MIYLIKYCYENQQADGSFHFVDAESETAAVERANEYIECLLSYRFNKDVYFRIEQVEEIK